MEIALGYDKSQVWRVCERSAMGKGGCMSWSSIPGMLGHQSKTLKKSLKETCYESHETKLAFADFTTYGRHNSDPMAFVFATP